jgi:L-ascorbate metabolism protein UlaG (beta-lactamase superfamily)
LSFGVEFTWFGTTSIALRMNSQTLLFDPFITHPNILTAVLYSRIDSNEDLVASWFKKAELKKINYVLVSHAHYDHILDLGTVLNKFPESTMYGSDSSVNFALGQDIKKTRLNAIEHKSKFSIDDVEVQSFKVGHSTHFLGITFMDGKIEKPFKLPASIWKMKKGDSFIYYLKGKFGKILFHPAGTKSPYYDGYSNLKADVLFMGIAKRGSTQRQIEEVISKVQPKIIVPLHHDNFLFDLKVSPEQLPGTNLKEWKKTLKEKYPKLQIIEPRVAKWIQILE